MDSNLTNEQLLNLETLFEGWLERAQVIASKRRGIPTPQSVAHRYEFTAPSAESVAARFFGRISAPTLSGCLEWLGASDKLGYGRMVIASRIMLAHRIAWIIFNGPIPDGLFVCHRCDNPPCCNVEHHFLGDHLANAGDSKRKGRNKWTPRPGILNNLAKLNEKDVLEIRRLAGSMTHRKIAERFGITRPNVGYIVNRKTWTELQ